MQKLFFWLNISFINFRTNWFWLKMFKNKIYRNMRKKKWFDSKVNKIKIKIIAIKIPDKRDIKKCQLEVKPNKITANEVRSFVQKTC